MTSIAEKIANVEKQKEKLLKRRTKLRANKTFLCGCGQRHRIKECVAIQTHWYESAWGCMGGDTWHEGELQIVCPVTDNKNRVLFNFYDVPWSKRSYYDYNPDMQFRRIYTPLFKEVIRDNDHDERAWWNNEYFDKHRKKFEICGKWKEIKPENEEIT